MAAWVLIQSDMDVFFARNAKHKRSPPMHLPNRGLLSLLLAIGPLVSLSAQDRQLEMAMPHVTSPAEGGRTLTGKERLGRKWTDEQRIDNCEVPIDKRGTKPRPSSCMPGSTGGSASDVLLRGDRQGISEPPN